MTRCRTGCSAEISYKEVKFFSVEHSYHIPMEGDEIHHCPKISERLGQTENLQIYWQEDGDTVDKDLEHWHSYLNNELTEMVYDYGSQISDFINLPQELRLDSKTNLATRLGVDASKKLFTNSKLTKEDYDKMPKLHKENHQRQQGFEPPGTTMEERLAAFFSDIDHVMGILQRCADMYPAPFYVWDEYSQLEYFRIFLESKEQYSDAMLCHTIQGAMDVPNTQEEKAAFAEISGRLHKKLEEQRLAQAEEDAKNSSEAKPYWTSEGLDKTADDYEEPDWEDPISNYSAGIMDWALSQYKKELGRKEKLLKALTVNLRSRLEKSEEQGVEDITKLDQEQSLDEMMKSHSQERFGPFHEGLRKLLLYIYNDQEKSLLEVSDEFNQDKIKMQKDKQDEKLYKMKYESELGYATIGQLIRIFRNKKTKELARKKGIKPYDEILRRCYEVNHIRNMMDHDEREELPKEYKMLLIANIFLLNRFFEDLKRRHLKRKK